MLWCGEEGAEPSCRGGEVATQEDWETEYLDSILAVKVVQT